MAPASGTADPRFTAGTREVVAADALISGVPASETSAMFCPSFSFATSVSAFVVRYGRAARTIGH